MSSQYGVRTQLACFLMLLMFSIVHPFTHKDCVSPALQSPGRADYKQGFGYTPQHAVCMQLLDASAKPFSLEEPPRSTEVCLFETAITDQQASRAELTQYHTRTALCHSTRPTGQRLSIHHFSTYSKITAHFPEAQCQSTHGLPSDHSNINSTYLMYSD